VSEDEAAVPVADSCEVETARGVAYVHNGPGDRGGCLIEGNAANRSVNSSLGGCLYEGKHKEQHEQARATARNFCAGHGAPQAIEHALSVMQGVGYCSAITERDA
jgi:hypothetical protein